MTAFYVTAYAKGVLQTRRLILALDESEAEIRFLRQHPECNGMAIIVEGNWK